MSGPSKPAMIRQPGLFRMENALTRRFGAGFFANLPAGPGVYFYYDRAGHLLYIGQSAGLRARIGSYRHVTEDRHPRRTLRLVSRIDRIEWELCETAADAIARERVLLLEHRPPFNRAGVWKGEPWWLSGQTDSPVLHLHLNRKGQGIGPLPASFRYVFISLARCIHRVAFPELPPHLFPHGLMGPATPLRLAIRFPDANAAWQTFDDCTAGRVETFLESFDALPVPLSLPQRDFWLNERERVVKYAARAGAAAAAFRGPDSAAAVEHPAFALEFC